MADIEQIRGELMTLSGRAGEHPAYALATAERIIARIALAERKRIVALLRERRDALARTILAARAVENYIGAERLDAAALVLQEIADELDREAP